MICFKMKCKIILCCILVVPVFGTREGKVMNAISSHVGNIVLECKEEMGFTRNVIEEFLAFWNSKHELKSTSQGCAIACVLNKLGFIKDGGTLNNENGMAFLKANGADQEMSSKIVELFGLCTRAAMSKDPEDGCFLALEIFKCFRYGIFRLHWAPSGSDTFYDT